MITKKIKSVYRYYKIKKILNKTKHVLNFIFSNEFNARYGKYLEQDDKYALSNLKARLDVENRPYLKPSELQMIKSIKDKIMKKEAEEK